MILRDPAALLTLALLLPTAAVAATGTTGAQPAGGRTIVELKSDPAAIVGEVDTVETGADFTWTVTLHLQNPGESGLYVDSLFCEIEDTDPGQTRAERTTFADLTRLVRGNASIEAAGHMVVQHASPALAESARLRYTMHVHRASGPTFARSTLVLARPGASTAYESKHLDVSGKRVEYVVVHATPDQGSHPGLLFVHGHGSHARHSIRLARQLSLRGYTVMAVSMPGYGTSDGPADLMGPATVTALERALDALRATPGVDTARVAAWGQSRGATAVAALAARRADLDAVILQSGIYDLWATHRGTKLDGFPAAIVAEAGQDSAAWSARSPILSAAKIAAPVLVLHGERDVHVPVGQARAFEARLAAAGRTVKTLYPARQAHHLAGGEVFRAVFTFLDEHLAK